MEALVYLAIPRDQHKKNDQWFLCVEKVKRGTHLRRDEISVQLVSYALKKHDPFR